MTKRYTHASLKHETNFTERLTAAIFATLKRKEKPSDELTQRNLDN